MKSNQMREITDWPQLPAKKKKKLVTKLVTNLVTKLITKFITKPLHSYYIAGTKLWQNQIETVTSTRLFLYIRTYGRTNKNVSKSDTKKFQIWCTFCISMWIVYFNIKSDILVRIMKRNIIIYYTPHNIMWCILMKTSF